MEGFHNRSRKIVSLFVATALVLASGCQNSPGSRDCIDRNNDGYCDDGGGGAGGASRYYGSGGGSSASYGTDDGSYKKSSSSGITSGAKGGIGSSGARSSG